MDSEDQSYDEYNAETLAKNTALMSPVLSGGCQSQTPTTTRPINPTDEPVSGVVGQSGENVPESQTEKSNAQNSFQIYETSQEVTSDCLKEVPEPLIKDKADQWDYNEESIEKLDKNIQDWYSNTGVTAVLITFIQGHIRILGPDHMSSLKRNKDFKQIFMTTLFQSQPGGKTIEKPEETDTITVFKCDECGRVFESEKHLRSHKLLAHMPQDLTTHQCKKCNKIFDKAVFLQSHLCSRTGKREHECKVCGTRYTTGSALKIHSRTHTQEKPWKCATCGQEFHRRSSYNYHMAKHTGDKQYKCSTCGKEFILMNNLRDHERIHSGERPFTCQECGKSFTVASTLRRHLLVHSGQKPYKCEACNSSFTRLVHLQSHMRTHSGERPYKCDECEKTFAQSSHLRRHQKLHGRNKTRTCDKCGKEVSDGDQHICVQVTEQKFRPLSFPFYTFTGQI